MMVQQKSPSPSERRRDPRLTAQVPVKISQEDGDLVTETANISRAGAYCRVERALEPMMKLKVQVLIPIRKNDSSVTTKKITCQGVVVRTERTPDNHYNVAIFFSDITKRDAECISDYVDYHLERGGKSA